MLLIRNQLGNYDRSLHALKRLRQGRGLPPAPRTDPYVHGALHAQGWDHETSEADALAMEAYEAAILARLGFANPY